MINVLPDLIDKQDTFEIVRDQIAGILVLETINQQNLAIAAAKDPLLWKLRVYAERSNPWEVFLNEPVDKSPVVNIWFDSGSYDPGASTTMERQKCDAIYNVDCYAYGESLDTVGGHDPGDKLAALNAHRTLRLCRNILMAAENTYLQLRGTVWSRWMNTITAFQPQFDDQHVQKIAGARLALKVEFSEFSPQIPLEVLEYLSAVFKRAEDGQIILQTDYDYTA